MLGERDEGVRVLHEVTEAAHMSARLGRVAVARAVVDHVVGDYAVAGLAQVFIQEDVAPAVVARAVQEEHDAVHRPVLRRKEREVEELLVACIGEAALEVLQRRRHQHHVRAVAGRRRVGGNRVHGLLLDRTIAK